jgi:formylglycine-generating enzyme required for sulfatase activity
MADIFISYAREDRDRAKLLAEALKEHGWSIWWDRDLPFGRPFDEVIRAELQAAGCVISLWTESAVKSLYVIGEARDALSLKKLISVFLTPYRTELPYDLQGIHGVELIDWHGDTSNTEFQRMVHGITSILEQPPQKKTKAETEHKVDEERKQKEAEEERRRKADDDRKDKEVEEDIKLDKPGTADVKPPEPRKMSNALKLVTVAGVIVLLITGIWWYISVSKQMKTRAQEQSLVEPELVETKPQKAITNSIGMKFVLIPAGRFFMGSPSDESERRDNERQYEVNINKPFYLQVTEVSQGQWENVIGNNPSFFKDCGDDCPVEQVSWYDVQRFISKLNQMEGTNKYRLPTEAEWEYACRAGTTTPFFYGGCISTDQANYNGSYPGRNCPKGRYREKALKVRSFQPNAWRLYDMHGNVSEWCQDWFGGYPSNPVADPKGPDEGIYRVMRGGSWYDEAWDLRSAFRGWITPETRYYNIGFRVARDF